MISRLRRFLIIPGALLLLPSWLVSVRWGDATTGIAVVPALIFDSFHVPQIIGKIFLLILGAVLMIAAFLLCRHLIIIRRSAATPSITVLIISIFFLLVGIICLEPTPVFLNTDRITFDVGRNLFASLEPFIRTLGAVLLIAGLGPAGRRRLGEPVTRLITRFSLARPIHQLLIAGGISFAAAVLFAVIGFNLFPSLRDEVAALFQAGIFARGSVTISPFPWHRFMEISPILTSPTWSSMYPPGWPMLLAAVYPTGLAWLISPLMAGFGASILFALVKREEGARTAAIALLLLLSSPFFLRMAGSYMTHIPAMTTVILFWYLIMDEQRQKPGRAIVAGCVLGLSLMIRPWSAFCMAFPAGYLAVRSLVSREWKEIRFWLIAGLSTFLSLSPYIAYNWLSTGSWLPGYSSRLGSVANLGFGMRAMGRHTPLLGLLHDAGRLFRLNTGMFGVPIPGIILVVWGFVAVRHNALRRTFLLGAISIWVGSGLYWWYEQWFGPRYVFEAFPVAAFLAAVGISALWEHDRWGSWVRAGLSAGLVWAVISAIPTELLSLSDGYGEVDRITVETLREARLNGAAVIIEDADENGWPHDTYTSAFLAMVLDGFRGGILLRDLNEENVLLPDLLPDREWYYYRHGDRYGEGSLTRIAGPTDHTPLP